MRASTQELIGLLVAAVVTALVAWLKANRNPPPA